MLSPQLLPGARFANTRVWTIDINEYGSKFYDVYHVVSSTPKSLALLCSTLYNGNVHVQGNQLMDRLTDARETNTPLLNQSITPRRYMLKKDAGGVYFVDGLGGTSSRIVRLNGKHPVTYIANGVPAIKRSSLKKRRNISKKRPRKEAGASCTWRGADARH